MRSRLKLLKRECWLSEWENVSLIVISSCSGFIFPSLFCYKLYIANFFFVSFIFLSVGCDAVIYQISSVLIFPAYTRMFYSSKPFWVCYLIDLLFPLPRLNPLSCASRKFRVVQETVASTVLPSSVERPLHVSLQQLFLRHSRPEACGFWRVQTHRGVGTRRV